MMNEIRINDKNRTIEITKTFSNLAKRFGTSQYDDLQAVRRDYPTYRVEIKKAKKKADCFKGLTFEFMERYIKNHNVELLENFFSLCGKDKDGTELEFAATATYGEIKKWFIDEFPELKLQRSKIDEILNKKVA